jgi:CRP/FNR family transcriptional regulator, cyclic AMP receptor protein
VETSRLASIPLFSGLTDRELAAIAAAASEVEANEGQVLATEGDFGHAMYVIETGTADVQVNGVTQATLGPGEVFGEIAAIASGRRTASVVATSPMRLITLFKRDLWALERDAPGAAERLRALISDRLAADETKPS